MRASLLAVLALGALAAVSAVAPPKRMVAVVGGKTEFQPGYIYVSEDSGTTWQQRGDEENWVSVASSHDGSRLVALKENYGQRREGGIYLSNNGGRTFDRIDAHNPSPHHISNSGDGEIFASMAAPADRDGQVIYVSMARGDGWDTVGQGRNWSCGALSADGYSLAAVEYNGYIHTGDLLDGRLSPKMAAGRRAWTAVTSSYDGRKLAAAATGAFVYTSTDAGNTWTEQKRSGARRWAAMATSADGNQLAAAAEGDSIFISRNGGKTWAATKAPKAAWTSIAASADMTQLVAVARDDFIYVSTDAGKTWAKRGERSNWSAVASQA